MAGTALKIIIFIVSVIIGVGVTLFFDSVIPGTDDLMLAGIAIVMTLAAFTSLYFMTKSHGGG